MTIRFGVFAALLLVAGSAQAQDSYSEWAEAGRPDFQRSGQSAALGERGTLQIFTDRAGFNLAGGDFLPVETFDGGSTTDNSVSTCGAVIEAGTASPCFNVGEVMPGFVLTSTASGNVVVLGTGLLGAGQTSDVAGADVFADTTEVTFSPAAPAVGADVYSNLGGDVTIEAFDAGGVSLGSATTTVPATDQPAFLGMVSPTPISSIVITGAGGSGELIDNLAFGSPIPPLQDVPTLSRVGLLLASLMIVLLGGLTIRSFAAS